MEEVLNNLIKETLTLKISNFKDGSVDDLIKLWSKFCIYYGVMKLEEYKYPNPPHKLIILDNLLKEFDKIRDAFNNKQSIFINFGLIYNQILQLR